MNTSEKVNVASSEKSVESSVTGSGRSGNPFESIPQVNECSVVTAVTVCGEKAVQS